MRLFNLLFFLEKINKFRINWIQLKEINKRASGKWILQRIVMHTSSNFVIIWLSFADLSFISNFLTLPTVDSFLSEDLLPAKDLLPAEFSLPAYFPVSDILDIFLPGSEDTADTHYFPTRKEISKFMYVFVKNEEFLNKPRKISKFFSKKPRILQGK